jgi:hypothetical protein
MKIITTLFLLLSFLTLAKGGDDKYTNAMEKYISSLDSAKTFSDFQQAANSFERIAATEKSKWLPFYYTSYCYTVSCFLDTVAGNKDIYLDKAELFINTADSLSPNNSEIYTLKGLITQGRLIVNPRERWQKYGQLASTYFNKASQLDPTNPRPDYLIGQSLLYTPEAFGGGKAKALPYLKDSMRKYEAFKPESSISPTWGKNIVKGILDKISDDQK